MHRYIIDTHGVDGDAEREAIAWLAIESRCLGVSGVIAVPNLDGISQLSGALGHDRAESLKTDRHIDIDGARIEVYTERNLPWNITGRPVFVPWASEAPLERIEETRPVAICAIPWAADDLAEWKRAHDPVDLRTGAPLGERPIELAPLLNAALVSLTAPQPHSSGIHHPNDKTRATRTFKALYITGEPLDQTEIRTWAIAHGWQPRHAAKLAELAGKIGSGKVVKDAAMNKTEAKQIIERLRAVIE